MPISQELLKVIEGVGDAKAKAAIINVLNSAPSLLNTYNSLAQKGGLTKIMFNPDPSDQKGYWDSKAKLVYIGLGAVVNTSGVIVPTKLAHVLGEEGQHAVFAPILKEAEKTFRTEAQKIVEKTDVIHDYTSIMFDIGEVNKENEGRASMAAWNAMVEVKMAEKGGPLTLKDNDLVKLVLETGISEFFDGSTGNLKSGFQGDPAAFGKVLETDPGNIAKASAQRSYATPSIDNGVLSDYIKYYKVSNLDSLCQLEIGQPGGGKPIYVDYNFLELDIIPGSQGNKQFSSTFLANNFMLMSGLMEGVADGSSCTIYNTADGSMSTFFFKKDNQIEMTMVIDSTSSQQRLYSTTPTGGLLNKVTIQKDTFEKTNKDGSVTRDVINYNPDGTECTWESTTTSADKKVKTTFLDSNGDGTWDGIKTETQIAAAAIFIREDIDGNGSIDRNWLQNNGTLYDLANVNDAIYTDNVLASFFRANLIDEETYYAWSRESAKTLSAAGSPSYVPVLWNNPIGAFYEVKSAPVDTAASIAAKTPVVMNAQKQKLSSSALQALDINADGKLSGTEIADLLVWVDANEDGIGDEAEFKTLSAAGITEIRSTDYGFMTRGNGKYAAAPVAAPLKNSEIAQPAKSGAVAAPAKNSEIAQPAKVNAVPVVPASNYRTLRDTDNSFLALTGSGYMVIPWTVNQVKINYNNQSYMIGTDGNDIFDANYYASYSYFNNNLLVNFLGGGGNDVVGGSARNDTIWGGTGNDRLLGYAGDDKLYGEEGDDQLEGGDGNDTLDGGIGADKLFGQVGNDIINGGDGDDIIMGFTASNEAKQTLAAGETDNDKLYGGAGNDQIWGGLGDDYIDGGDGADLVVGGQGVDTIFGGTGNDELHGNEGNDKILGEAGDDRMFGEVGNDVIWGGDGADTLYGGTGDDQITAGNGNDTVLGEAGNDSIFGGAGNDQIWGGDGDDILFGFTASNDAKQTLATGETDNDTLYGGAGNDEIWGGLGDDYIDGGDGADLVVGGQGVDTIFGGTGNDELHGNEGSDKILGEAGDDRIFGEVGNDVIWGGDGNDLILGFAASNDPKQTLLLPPLAGEGWDGGERRCIFNSLLLWKLLAPSPTLPRFAGEGVGGAVNDSLWMQAA